MSMKNLPLTRLLLLLLILAAACFSANAFQDHPSPSLDNSRESLIQARGNFKSSASPSADYYQPALIGFRPEGGDEVTSNGISVIEANTPIRLTLFGELFTTNTIVAFTTEFRQDFDLDPALSTHTVDQSKPQQAEVAATTSAPAATTTTATPETSPSKSEFAKTVDHNDGLQAATQANGTTTAAQVVDAQLHGHRQFAHRRRTQSKSYDCTDYNRIISYKLNEANILSPNIAVIEVTLPEISVQSGLYYYFCLKQPALGYSQQSAREHLDTNATEQLIWVHQGAEWWVTLRVEPPFLSIANDCFLIVLLLVLSAVASGLNLGLMSLDMNELAVISSCGDQRERSYARTIAPLRKRGNYLLCALLLSNVAVNSTLTVILEQMTSGLVAVIGSTLAIVVLGEIVPQAICARQGLAIGARTIYVTYAFMILTFPLSYPISWLLDHVLGAEKGHVYDRERLMEFIKITGHHTQLDAEEVAIISGALKLKKIKVDQIMTRIEDVFMLPIDCKLDRETIKRIIEKGYSRIPVYEFGDRKQIVALILAKDLALLDPDDHTPIANMLMYCRHPLIFIEDDATLDVALNEFKTGKSHMAVVRQIYDDGETDKYYEAIGVVTLEDVIEEVLQAEINDETDILSDNRRKRRRTDCAQLSHLMIDELTRASSGSQQSGSHLTVGAAMLQNSCDSSQPLCGKQIQTSLSSHLTSVSIGNPPAETKPPQSQFAANLQESSGQFEQKQITVIEVADRSPAQSRKRQPEVAAEVDEPGDRDALRVVSDPESGGGEHLRQRRDTQVREHESLGLELERPDSGLLVRAAQFFTNIMP